ncbi:MAG: hypothetical protein HZA50_12255 [Planctomycetes bacterium]|nr:hypothetical protein [Planctomycetota bacterium]
MKQVVLFLAVAVALAGLSGCAVISEPDGNYFVPPQAIIKVLKDGKNFSLQLPASESVPLTQVSGNEYTCRTSADPNAKVVFVRNQQGQVVNIAITEKGETRTFDKMAK